MVVPVSHSSVYVYVEYINSEIVNIVGGGLMDENNSLLMKIMFN